ncbi:hypothetical protein BD779DRAFT_1478297 [Infundibulicybe gibba]|nr:hypothetical protein BD779DRAFT_1478297 [Infundibulicybe gibba]
MHESSADWPSPVNLHGATYCDGGADWLSSVNPQHIVKAARIGRVPQRGLAKSRESATYHEGSADWPGPVNPRHFEGSADWLSSVNPRHIRGLAEFRESATYREGSADWPGPVNPRHFEGSADWLSSVNPQHTMKAARFGRVLRRGLAEFCESATFREGGADWPGSINPQHIMWAENHQRQTHDGHKARIWFKQPSPDDLTRPTSLTRPLLPVLLLLLFLLLSPALQPHLATGYLLSAPLMCAPSLLTFHIDVPSVVSEMIDFPIRLSAPRIPAFRMTIFRQRTQAFSYPGGSSCGTWDFIRRSTGIQFTDCISSYHLKICQCTADSWIPANPDKGPLLGENDHALMQTSLLGPTRFHTYVPMIVAFTFIIREQWDLDKHLSFLPQRHYHQSSSSSNSNHGEQAFTTKAQERIDQGALTAMWAGVAGRKQMHLDGEVLRHVIGSAMVPTADVFSSSGKLIARARQFHFGTFNDRNLIPDETKKMLGGMAGGCFSSSYQHAMKALIKVDDILVGDLSQDRDDLPSGKLTFLKAKPSQPIVMFGGQHRHAAQAALRKRLEDALDNLQKKRTKLELIATSSKSEKSPEDPRIANIEADCIGARQEISKLSYWKVIFYKDCEELTLVHRRYLSKNQTHHVYRETLYEALLGVLNPLVDARRMDSGGVDYANALLEFKNFCETKEYSCLVKNGGQGRAGQGLKAGCTYTFTGGGQVHIYYIHWSMRKGMGMYPPFKSTRKGACTVHLFTLRKGIGAQRDERSVTDRFPLIQPTDYARRLASEPKMCLEFRGWSHPHAIHSEQFFVSTEVMGWVVDDVSQSVVEGYWGGGKYFPPQGFLMDKLDSRWYRKSVVDRYLSTPTDPYARLVNSESRIYGIQLVRWTGVRIQMRSNMVNVSPTKYGKETPPTSNTRKAYIIGSFRRAEHTNEPDMAANGSTDPRPTKQYENVMGVKVSILVISSPTCKSVRRAEGHVQEEDLENAIELILISVRSKPQWPILGDFGGQKDTSKTKTKMSGLILIIGLIEGGDLESRQIHAFRLKTRIAAGCRWADIGHVQDED